MPTPQGIQTVTLHGRFVEPDLTGTPLVGQVTFTPSPAPITFPDQDTIVSGTEVAELDGNGEFYIDLICTDTANQNPDGWTYLVTEKLVGVRPRSYNILLPYTIAVVELADVTPTPEAPTYLPVVGPQGPPGVVTSVNGISQPDIILDAADVAAVPASAKGAAGGVATLDASALVPTAQIPDLSGTYVAVTRIGAASGVAGLDAGALVPASQLALANAAPPPVGVGAIGASTDLAREDHTHDGVGLTGDQSIAGLKTFTGDLHVSGPHLTAGIDPATAIGRVHFATATAGETLLYLVNTSGASTAGLLKIEGDTDSSALIVTKVTGDTQNSYSLRGSGTQEYGDGMNPRDTSFYRSAPGVMNSSGQFAADAAAPSAVSHLTRKDYVDGLDAANVKLSGTQTLTGSKVFEMATSGLETLTFKVASEANDRLYVRADGRLLWGDGVAGVDTSLYRDGVAALRTNGSITVETALKFSDGVTGTDTELHRDSAGVLGTPGSMTVDGDLTVGGTIFGNFAGASMNSANGGNTTSTTYGALTGGDVISVTVETGTDALICLGARAWNDGVHEKAWVSFEVTGATVLAPDDVRAFCAEGSGEVQGTYSFLYKALTPGTNTFTLRYRTAGGTGEFDNMHLSVIPM